MIKISLTFVLKSQMNNIPALAQIMAWRRPGDKPLSEAMMVSLLTHIFGLSELIQVTTLVIQYGYMFTNFTSGHLTEMAVHNKQLHFSGAKSK